MKPEILWQSKLTSVGTYQDELPLTSFGIDEDDLDNDSFREINFGNLIDSVISKSWVKAKVGIDRMTVEELKALLPRLRTNPLYVKLKVPVFGNDWTEYEVRIAKRSYDMNQDGTWRLSFNMTQKTKVAGQ